MDNETVIRDLVLKWVEQDQKHIVLAALIARRVSGSVADKLVRGKYPQEPQGAIRTVIEDELKKAGILPEAAS